jgi:2-polyprenyl-3-methyl-5-hydroxy-6-metoxy-1,4-benzoquinol methylase
MIKGKTIKQKKEHGNIDSSLEYFLKFNIPKNAKILDIGCNYGSLIYNLYKDGYKNVYGIDINKKTIEEGKKYYKKIRNRIKIYNGGKNSLSRSIF